MRPDIKIHDYYINFIANAKKDIDVYKKEIEYFTKLKDKQLEFIKEHKDTYENTFKIFIEDEHVAVKRAEFLIRVERNEHNRFLLSQISKYGYSLNKIKEYNRMIILANKRKNLKFREYESYVMRYYNKVQYYVLKGFGYKYSHGIGILCICRWKIKENGKLTLDYNATNIKKKEIIALGKKVWNKNEAAWYEARGIPYNAIDPRVYRRDSHIYIIDIVKSKLFTNRNHIFEHTEYVNSKFKGMSYQAMADICKDLNEISNFPVDLKYKLNMLLYKDPSNYILFIRNNEQDNYEYGAHNS